MSARSAVIIGVLLNSALYLVCCFVAGLVVRNGWAWRLAIAAMGMTYLCYLVQLAGAPHGRTVILAGYSILLGAAAGIALLF